MKKRFNKRKLIFKTAFITMLIILPFRISAQEEKLQPADQLTAIKSTLGEHSAPASITDNGNVLIPLIFKGTITLNGLDIQTPNDTSAIILYETSQARDASWFIQLGKSTNIKIEGILRLGNGNIIIHGNYSGFLQFGNKTLTSSDETTFLAVLDKNAQLKWIKEVESTKHEGLNYAFTAEFNMNGELIKHNFYDDDADFIFDQKVYVTSNFNLLLIENKYQYQSAWVDYTVRTRGDVDAVTYIGSLTKELVSKESYDKSVSGIFSVMFYLLKNDGNSINGSILQKGLDKYNPSFESSFPDVYRELGKIKNIVQKDEMVEVTLSNKRIVIDQLILENHAKFKIITYRSGDVKLKTKHNIFVTHEGKEYELNSVVIDKETGDLEFNVFAGMGATVNLKDILKN